PQLRAGARRRTGGGSAADHDSRLNRTGDGRGRLAVEHPDVDHADAVHSAGARGRDRRVFREAGRRQLMNQVQAHTTLKITRRLRRLRQSEAMRAMVRETRLAPEMFMLPLFVCEGEGVPREVPSMPGVFNLSVDEAVKEVAAARADGVTSVILFGLPEHKDDIGSSAYDPEAPVQSAVRAIKREVDGVVVATDVCLCEYTDHG